MSPKYSLDKVDFLKILKGAGYAIGQSLAVYLLAVYNNFDFSKFPAWALYVVPVIAIALNAAIKFFQGNQAQ